MANNNKMKVLYAISSLANEGPTRVLLNIVKNLDKDLFSASVVTFTDEKPSSLLSEFQDLGIPIYQLARLPSGGQRRMFDRLFQLRNLIRMKGFQIAHAHCPRSQIFLVASKTRSTKTFYTLHIFPGNQYSAIHGAVKGRLIALVSNFLLRFIDKPVACSESVAYEFLTRKGIKVSAVNNGIEPIVIPPNLTRDAAQHLLNLDPSRRYLLYVGRLSPEKRIVELVETFLKSKSSGIDLVVVGSGPDEHALRALSCPRVHLKGFQSDIRPFLAACDFYVSPSSTEGLANTLLEAMSAGLPSLLSEIPSHDFVISGSSNFIAKAFNPLSAESLDNGIACLQEGDSQLQRLNIRKEFEMRFNAKVMTLGYENLYREMM